MEQHPLTHSDQSQTSKTVSIDLPAPDFLLNDFAGRPVRLSDYRGRSHVVLVLNRGFL